MIQRILRQMRYIRGVLLSTWRRFRSSQNTKLLGMATIIGISTGIMTWGFRFGIDLVELRLMAPLRSGYLGYFGLLAPVLLLGATGMLVGWLTNRYVGTERHRGITGIIESVAVGGGHLPYWQMPLKALASMLSIGGGASVGVEDPSVQIGSNLGAFFGQRFRLEEDQRRLLISAGAASATSAAFNAPIAGVFFALEVIMNSEFSSKAVGVIVLSAVISAAFSQSFGITETTLQQPLGFTFEQPYQIIYFLPLALILAPVAIAFIRTLAWQISWWQRRGQVLPYPVQTGVAGMLVGIVGVVFPSVLGSGQDAMRAVLEGNVQFSLWLLSVLVALKVLLTSMSIGGGFVGGVFTPSLFVGTMLGDFYGQIMVRLLPDVSDPRTFAIAGMAGVMVGVIRAPITAIMLVFELTNDYRMILPIMLVAIVCMYLTQVVEPKGVYLRTLALSGLHLQEGRDVDIMRGIVVSEVMREPTTIPEYATLKQLRDAMHDQHRREMILVDERSNVTGIVTLTDLQAAYDRDDHGESLSVGDIAIREVITTDSTESMWLAVRKMAMHGVGRLPVVERGTHRLVGILNRHDMVRAYNATITRKIREKHYAEQIRLQHLTGAHVFELNVTKQAPVANHQIAEIKFPSESTIASIQRDGKLLIPHGDVRILPKDVVTMIAAPEAEGDIARLFGL